MIFYGLPASPGVSHGPAFRFLHRDVEVLEYEVGENDHESEIQRFMQALKVTQSQIRQIREDVSKNLSEKNRTCVWNFDKLVEILNTVSINRVFVQIQIEILRIEMKPRQENSTRKEMKATRGKKCKFINVQSR